MARYVAVVLLTLVAGTAWAQGNKPGANAPAPAKPGNGPGANAPGNGPPAGPPSAAARKITLRAPAGGDYTAYIQEAPAVVPRTLSDIGELEVPANLAKYTVYILDNKTGYAARKTVDAKAAPAELTFTSQDFKLVQKVQVKVTGKDDKPIAQGLVTLIDGGKNPYRKTIQPASQGAVDFDMAVMGSGQLTVVPQGGGATTKEVPIELKTGETVQVIGVSLPEVTATVEPTAPAPGASAPPGAAANTPANTPGAGPTGTQPQPGPGAPLPQPPQPGDNIGGTVVGFLFLIALVAAAYLYARNRGITMDMVLRKLGVQPDTAVAGGGNVPGGQFSTSGTSLAPAPGTTAPMPPPIVADPNQCQFCGQMKDAAGNCACTVAPGSLSAPASLPGGGGPGAGSGPRLVGMAGTYMGQVFPIFGMAVIGREATNPVPLDRDTTTSRRHAQITADGGVYRIQDLGSSNGTFVNGAKITEAVLSPGDEVSIGGTRFRFEV
jgi:FHA domain-containing protein